MGFQSVGQAFVSLHLMIRSLTLFSTHLCLELALILETTESTIFSLSWIWIRNHDINQAIIYCHIGVYVLTWTSFICLGILALNIHLLLYGQYSLSVQHHHNQVKLRKVKNFSFCFQCLSSSFLLRITVTLWSFFPFPFSINIENLFQILQCIEVCASLHLGGEIQIGKR